jgi:hypothetical protein
VIDMSKLTGVTLYEPEELVSVGASRHAARRDARHCLREHRQEFAFEPMDYAPLLGGVGWPDRQEWNDRRGAGRKSCLAHAASKPGRRVTTSSAFMPCRDVAKCSSPAGAW